jgi:serine/threonine protein kinase
MDLGGRILAGRYRLGSLLGVGGMARVYTASDRGLERQVAVKVLSRPLPRTRWWWSGSAARPAPPPGWAIPASWPWSTAAPMPTGTTW